MVATMNLFSFEAIWNLENGPFNTDGRLPSANLESKSDIFLNFNFQINSWYELTLEV